MQQQSPLIRIWNDLEKIQSSAQLVHYWEERQKRILESLQKPAEPAAAIIAKLAKALNDKEKYASVFYLFKAGYVPIADQLQGESFLLQEAKFELARGLHHNRKYGEAKKLFNELAASGFELSRIHHWWDQSAFASRREKIWLKADVLPGILSFLMMFSYIIISIRTQLFFWPTTLFIIFYELFAAWRYHFKISLYLVEYKNQPETDFLKKKLWKMILIELVVSLLFYPAYYLKPGFLTPLVIIIAVYTQIFNFWLNYNYLPRLVGEMNRQKTRSGWK